VAAGLRPPGWLPYPDSPQERAYDSPADELFYGGSAGGGKTDLLLGLAGAAHRRSVIFRREFPQMRAMVERSREIFGGGASSTERQKDPYNESLHIWRLGAGRLLEFAAMQHEKDKESQRGRDRDYYGWDEVTQFTESQFRFTNAWNRSTYPGQRCRVVATGNPPTSSEGEWVIRYWAPWLDSAHPNPARPGELRWFARVDDRDAEVPGPGPVTFRGEAISPRSRTFIPARLSDNPILAQTGYRAMLQGLPEPLRSQMLYGDFGIGVADDAWQVIPTAWVRAAQARWTETPPPRQAQTAVGADVAYGGADSTVAVARFGPWFARPKKYQGAVTDSGRKAAHLILKEHQGGRVNVDAIGYGAACAEALRDVIGGLAVAVNVAAATELYDRSRKYRLTNVRAAMYWRLREALDPETGDNLALPPDQEVLADLTSVRYEVRASGIVLEEKKKLKERIGRSPDCGDALCLAHWQSSCGPFEVTEDPESRSLMADPPKGVFLS
jgi:hypothetical protein